MQCWMTSFNLTSLHDLVDMRSAFPNTYIVVFQLRRLAENQTSLKILTGINCRFSSFRRGSVFGRLVGQLKTICIMCNKDICRPTCRPVDTHVGRHPPILHRHWAYALPTLGQHNAHAFCQLLIMSSIFSTQLLNNLF